MAREVERSVVILKHCARSARKAHRHHRSGNLRIAQEGRERRAAEKELAVMETELGTGLPSLAARKSQLKKSPPHPELETRQSPLGQGGTGSGV